MASFRNILLLIVTGFLACGFIAAEETDKPRLVERKHLPQPVEVVKIKEATGFVMLPAEGLRTTPQPWIWFASTGSPSGIHAWMLQEFADAGIAIVGLDVGRSYGSPAGTALFQKFYELLVARVFARKPVLLGMNEGGLMAGSWAADHPELVAGLAGVIPVFDFRTAPGMMVVAKTYGLTEKELESQRPKLNPIERMSVLAKAKVPVFLVQGEIRPGGVSPDENSRQLQRLYEEAGATEAFTWLFPVDDPVPPPERFYRCQELVDFAIARAREAAEAKK